MLFNKSDFVGYFGVCFDGYIEHPVHGRIPVAAVGMLLANGHGQLRLFRTINIGGDVHEQSAQGAYDFDAQGIGTATIEVSEGPMKIEAESFRFVLDEGRRELQFISKLTMLHQMGGSDVSLTVVVRGSGQKAAPYERNPGPLPPR
jgi:hypothetical protein